MLPGDGLERVLGAHGRAEAALRDSEARYRDIFNAAADAMVLRDEEFRVVDVNAAFVAISGFSREEALGADRVLGGKPEPDSVIRERHRKVLAGEPVVIETLRVRKDGSRVDVELRCMPIQHQGRPHVLYISRDISARKRAEEALRASEEQYRSIFNATEDWMVLRDANFRVVDVNAAYLAVIGCTREEALGQDRVLGQDPDGLDQLLKARHAGVLAGEPMVVETQRTRQDGRRFDLELRGMPAQHRGKPHVLYIGRDISERKRAEEALRVSEEQYRSIFNAAHDSMVLRDAHFGIVDVNTAYTAMTGYSREEVLGRDGVTTSPPEMEESIKALHRRALDGEPVLIEAQHVRKDGRRFELELRGVPAQHQGRPHVLYVGRDISERKRAEEALRVSEEQYRSIFNASQDTMVLRDADFRVVDVNAAYVAVTGFSREETVGQDCVLGNDPPEFEQLLRAQHHKVLAGESMVLETERVRRDGRREEREMRAVRVMHQGKPHVLYIGRDIAERKRAEEALRASEEQYRSIFNTTTDALVLRDAEQRVVDVNPAFLAMTGYTRDEVVNETRWFLGSQMVAEARHIFRRVIAGEALRCELRGSRKDGSPFEVEIHAVPMRYRGRPHVLAMARDITARKRADAERAQLEAQLRQAHKMEAIGHLTGGIAHDFNNLLTGIQGYARLAAERPASAPDAKLASYLESIALACNRARELIQQMLVFSRGGRGARRALMLAPLVEQAIRLLRSSLPATVEIAAAYDFDLPAALLDPVQAEQVLMNLCINARDAMRGQGTIRIAVSQAWLRGEAVCASCRGRVAGEFVELTVADSGRGITPEVMDRMFEPFFSTKEAGHGSGMGLSIVHGIVHECGGHILVESGAAGARFRVLFPAIPAQHAQDEPRENHGARLRPRLSGRVLLVDDEDMVVNFMRELLQGWGLEITAVKGAMEAQELFAGAPQRFDLVLTDYTMPRMTGLELAGALRVVRPTLPVILYSGYTDAIPEPRLREAGVDLVQKPIDPDALLVALRKHL